MRVTIGEMMLMRQDTDFEVELFAITEDSMDKAKSLIQELRKNHKELRCKVFYTCVCDVEEHVTKWYFAYKTDEYMSLDIQSKNAALWERIFNDSSISYSSLVPLTDSNTHPCICPFEGD